MGCNLHHADVPGWWRHADRPFAGDDGDDNSHRKVQNVLTGSCADRIRTKLHAASCSGRGREGRTVLPANRAIGTDKGVTYVLAFVPLFVGFRQRGSVMFGRLYCPCPPWPRRPTNRSKKPTPVPQLKNRPPNILFIMTDQQHADMMSCAGNPYLKTPAMDSLARDGIRFANAYAANPVCVPSRIGMATGVMPGRLGVFNNGMKADVPHDVDAHSLGKLIKSAGYDTFYGGKVHMCAELTPLNAGYDEYFKDQRDGLPAACIEFIERKRDRPFFVVASFINPHDICFAYSAYKGTSPKGKQSVEHLYRQAAALPLDELPPLPDNYAIPPDEPHAIQSNFSPRAVTPAGTMRKEYDERQWRIYRWIYCRLTEQVDRHIGQILDAVKRNGLEDRDADRLHQRSRQHGRESPAGVKGPLLRGIGGRAIAHEVQGHHPSGHGG